MQMTCSEHCLNWKEEDIMVITNLLAQSLHLSELPQGMLCDSLLEISGRQLQACTVQEEHPLGN